MTCEPSGMHSPAGPTARNAYFARPGASVLRSNGQPWETEAASVTINDNAAVQARKKVWRTLLAGERDRWQSMEQLLTF